MTINYNRYKPFIKKLFFRLIVPFALLYIVILHIGSWYINSHKAQFRETILKEAHNVINREFSIGEINASAWRSFPYLRVGITDIALKDSVYHKPLLQIEDVHIGLSLVSLILKKIDFSSLTLKDGLLHLYTDTTGYSNAYLLNFKKKEKTSETKESKIKFDIFNKTVIVRRFQVTVEDAQKHKHFGGYINKIKTSVHRSGKDFAIDLKQDLRIDGLGFKLSNGSFLKNMPMVTNWKDMKYAPGTQVLSFGKSDVYFRDTLYQIGGWFNFSSDSATSHMHLNVSANKTTFLHASSILSENIQSKLHAFGWTGIIKVNATLDGSLHQSTPSIQVKATTKNSTLILPNKAAQIDSCGFTGYYNNQQIKPQEEPDDTNSVIHLDKFVGKLNSAELKGSRIYVQDLIHPYISIHLTSNAKLINLDKSLDFKTVRFTDGKAKLALNYDGPAVNSLHAIENMSGSLDFQNAAGIYIPNNFPFHDLNGKVDFGRQFLTIEQLRFYINQNHFLINVKGIRAAEDTALFGVPEVDCDVKASGININNFLAIFNNDKDTSVTNRNTTLKTSISKQTLPIDEIFQKGKLRLHLSADSTIYNNFKGENIRAVLVFHDNHWSIDTLHLNHSGGTIDLKSVINKHKNYNDVAFFLHLNNLDIRKTFYAFDNFGIGVIGYQNLQGKIFANGEIHTKINNNGGIVKRSTNGHLDFDFDQGELLNFHPLMNIQKYLFQNRNLTDVKFEPIHSAFDLQNGIVYLHPLYIQSSFINLRAEGIYSPYGQTDMSVRIPYSSLKTANDTPMNMLKKVTNPKHEATLNLDIVGKNKEDAQIKVNLFHSIDEKEVSNYYWNKYLTLKNIHY